MGEFRSPRPLGAGQVLAILASTLILFFLISFVGKAVQAHRLRNWRDQLQQENAEMVRQLQELETEVERRKTDLWVAELLRDAGQLPPGGVKVIPVPVTPAAAAPAVPVVATVGAEGAPNRTGGILDGPQWKAWMRLIWGFD